MLSTDNFISKLRVSDWAHLRSEYFWIYEDVVAPEYLDNHDHVSGQSALLMLEGELRVESPVGTAVAREGQWCFPTQGGRRQLFSKNARVLSLHFRWNWPGGEPLFDSPVALVFDADSSPQLEKCARRMQAAMRRMFPHMDARLFHMRASLSDFLAINRIFADWLDAYAEAMVQQGLEPSRQYLNDERVIKAVQVLDSLPLDTSLDVPWLAREVGLSASQLDRLYTRQFNLTPHQYFERRKLNHAIELMHITHLTIKQIAYELGFQSLSYFSSWFRQKVGASPRNFRKQPHRYRRVSMIQEKAEGRRAK